jgi:hypothetical protein
MAKSKIQSLFPLVGLWVTGQLTSMSQIPSFVKWAGVGFGANTAKALKQELAQEALPPLPLHWAHGISEPSIELFKSLWL